MKLNLILTKQNKTDTHEEKKNHDESFWDIPNDKNLDSLQAARLHHWLEIQKGEESRCMGDFCGLKM